MKTSTIKTDVRGVRKGAGIKRAGKAAMLVAAAAMLFAPAVWADGVELPAGDAPAAASPATRPSPVVTATPVETAAPTAGPTTAPSVAADDLAPVDPPAEAAKVAETAKPAEPAAAVPVIAAAPATRPAEAVSILEDIPANGRINLLVGRSLVVKTKSPYKRVSMTAPDVAGDNEVDPNTILLTAKKAGATQLIVWDDRDHSQVLDVQVDVDLNALTDMVKKGFPGTEVNLASANGTIVARGRVPNLEVAKQIEDLLGSYGKVLNFLEMAGGQQVMLQVRFAEVSRSATSALGVNFGFADGRGARLGSNVPGGGPFQVGGNAGQLTSTAAANVTLFGGGSIGSTQFDVFVSALRNNNLLRVLAEPNLSTLSGKEAKFLAGGEFPIPVPQAGGSGNAAITVEYKKYGIQLKFTPVVLGDGKIRLQGDAEVSDLDFNRSVAIGGFSIPSLTTRTVSTTIELSEGQTFALAGLLNNRITTSKQAVPLLGDIPVLGALFRSVRYERSETELVVLVTPRLVEGMNPKQVPELPGERWTYPTESDLFLNQYLGGPGRDPSAAAKPGPVMFRGPYGFVPAGGGARPKAPTGDDRVTAVDGGQP